MSIYLLNFDTSFSCLHRMQFKDKVSGGLSIYRFFEELALYVSKFFNLEFLCCALVHSMHKSIFLSFLNLTLSWVRGPHLRQVFTIASDICSPNKNNYNYNVFVDKDEGLKKGFYYGS